MRPFKRITLFLTICGILAIGLGKSPPASAQGPSLGVPPLYLDLSPALAELQAESSIDIREERPVQLTEASIVSPTRKDSRRVRRGGSLTAAGVPLFVAGAGGLAWGGPLRDDNCYSSSSSLRSITLAGAASMTLGLGLTTGGIVSLVRASRAARASKSPGTRAAIAMSALAGLLGVASVFMIGTFSSLGCYSS